MSYSEANAQIVDRNEIWKSDIICKIQPPTTEELNLLENRVLISLLKPHNNHQLFESTSTQGSTLIALDCIPRTISRGQSYDVLSSQAGLLGYKAVIEAASELKRLMAGQMTAWKHASCSCISFGDGCCWISRLYKPQKIWVLR